MFKSWFCGSLFLLCASVACTQQEKKKTTGEQFFEYANHFQRDSLAMLLSEDFELSRSYTRLKDNKEGFLNQYLLYSKELNGKFHVIKTLPGNDPQTYLVQDESDYYKYTGILPPKWRIEITEKNGKISSVLIDTTAGYYLYVLDSKNKGEAFTKWSEVHYPKETFNEMVKTPGLLNKRFKEYAAGKNQ